MDYFHYKYECPYNTGTTANTAYCEKGSKVVCPSVARAREYILKYCANTDGWKNCTIAQMITRSYDMKYEIQKGVKEWQRKQQKNS